MTAEEVFRERFAAIDALEWLLAATLARTFKSEAEARAWGEAATQSALVAAERRLEQPSAQQYQKAIDRVVSKAVSFSKAR